MRMPAGAALFFPPGSLANSVNAVVPEVQVVDPTVESNWDLSVVDHPQSGFFHGAAWAAVLKETYRHTPMYVTVRSGGECPAMWPIMEVNSSLTGRRGVSLPFTDECEPLFHPRTSPKATLAAVCEMGRARGWRYFEFRGGRQHFPGIEPSVSFVGHRLTLCRDTKAVFNRCEDSVRRAIRKARQAGLRTEISHDEAAIRTYYSLHCRTRKRHGVPPQPYAFFQSIHRHVVSQDKGFVVLARHNDQAISAAIFFHQGAKAIYKFGASDAAWQHLRGNNLVMWTAIEYFALQGCESLCFGRSSLADEGLRRFKAEWGSEERLIEYCRYDLRKEAFVKSRDLARGWQNRLFRWLPIWASRRVGAVLYPHWT